MIELERSGRGPSAVRPVATNSQHLSSQVRTLIKILFLCTVETQTVERKITRPAFRSATNTQETTPGKVLNLIEAFQR